jgi:hypothetical protein
MNGAGLSGDEAGLDVTARTAVRLAERGLVRLALDVARYHVEGNPVFTTVQDGRVFAWLPGFRDPRCAAPDDAYDLTDRVLLDGGVDEVRAADGTLLIGGFCYLSQLPARPDDDVTVVLRREDGLSQRVAADRVRRPDLTRRAAAEVDRLAWTGFCAEIDPGLFGGERATWAVEVELGQDGVVRTGPLVASRAAGLPGLLPFDLRLDDRNSIRVAGTAAGLTLEPAING